jgi:hypothetical protein
MFRCAFNTLTPSVVVLAACLQISSGRATIVSIGMWRGEVCFLWMLDGFLFQWLIHRQRRVTAVSDPSKHINVCVHWLFLVDDIPLFCSLISTVAESSPGGAGPTRGPLAGDAGSERWRRGPGGRILGRVVYGRLFAVV